MNDLNRQPKIFNEGFWAFIYLLTSSEGGIYLSLEGKVLRDIVRDGGCCESISREARRLGFHKPKMCNFLKEFEKRGHLTTKQNGKCKSIHFDEKIVKIALSLPYRILENEL